MVGMVGVRGARSFEFQCCCGFLYWMDWPGFVDGTMNAPPAQLVAIPQEGSTGSDSFGNDIEEFKFLTA